MRGYDNSELGGTMLGGMKPFEDKGIGALDLVNILGNKDEYISDRQTSEIGKLMASVKLPDVDAQLQPLLLNALDETKRKMMERYKTSKNKLRPDNNAKFGLQRDMMEFNQQAGYLATVSKDFVKGQERIAGLIKEGVLDHNDVIEMEKGWNKSIRSAKDPGNVPMFSAYINNAAGTKIAQKQRDYALKDVTEADNVVMDQFKGKSYSMPTEAQMMEKINAAWPDDQIKVIQSRYQKLGSTPQDPNEFKKMLARKYMATGWDREKAGGTSVNNYGVKNTKDVPFVTNDDNTKSWIFQDQPVNYTKGPFKGYIIGVTKSSDGKFYGEFSVPEMTESQEKSFFSLGGKMVVDKFKNKVYLAPLDASDYGAIKRKGLDLENADTEGFDALGKQRDRSSKTEKSEADQLGI